jgi:DNA-binding HxlR family transcriptional regulator
MGASYHQFCPVAKAMELLDERWTMLVIRELLIGSRRFNELRRGLPRMSPTLLSRRLHQLTVAGIVERDGDGYLLTGAGHELRPIVDALSGWGIRWIGVLGDTDLDPKLLLWDMHRNVDHEALPPGRSVIAFRFIDVRPPSKPYWWLVLTKDDCDVCDVDPEFPVSVTVRTTLRRMTEVWRGDVSWAAALRAATMELDGPAALRRAVSGWFTLPRYASLPRPARV